jgi:hypothetical protein
MTLVRAGNQIVLPAFSRGQQKAADITNFRWTVEACAKSRVFRLSGEGGYDQ